MSQPRPNQGSVRSDSIPRDDRGPDARSASSSSVAQVASSSSNASPSSSSAALRGSADLRRPSLPYPSEAPVASSSSHTASSTKVGSQSSVMSEASAKSSLQSATPDSESTATKVHFGPAVRRGGWRNFASVAVSRDHSEQGSTDEENGGANAVSGRRPSTVKRGSGSSRHSSSGRRISTKSLGDDDDDDDDYGDNEDDDGVGQGDGEDATGTWSQTGPFGGPMSGASLEELPTMPTPRSSSPSNSGLMDAAPNLDWANFIHAYALGKWNPSKEPKPPGQSSVVPGISTRIAYPASTSEEAGASDGYITPEPSIGGSRRPSLSYDVQGLSEQVVAPTPAEGVKVPLPSLYTALEAARRRGSIPFSPADFGGRPTTYINPALFRSAGTEEVTDDVFRRRQAMEQSSESSAAKPGTKSTPAKSTRLASYVSPDSDPSTGNEMADTSAELAEEMQSSPRSAPDLSLPSTGLGQKPRFDESVWRSAHHVGTMTDACEQPAPEFKGRNNTSTIERQSKDVPLAANERAKSDDAQATDGVGAVASAATPFPARIQDAPHLRPGPTPVQLQDYRWGEGTTPAVWQSAPEGFLSEWRINPQSGTEAPAPIPNEAPFWIGQAGENGTVAGLRRAARRASVLKGSDSGEDPLATVKPINIHMKSYVSDPGERAIAASQPLAPKSPLASKQTLAPASEDSQELQDGSASPRSAVRTSSMQSVAPSEAANAKSRSVTKDSSPMMIVTHKQKGKKGASDSNELYLEAGKQAENFYIEHGYLPAIIPPNEAERRQALNRYGSAGSIGNPHFDRVGHLVRLVFNAEVVLISLVGTNSQYLQTALGGQGISHEHLQKIAGSRHCSFCAHAILQDSDEPLVVMDTTKDWRFMGNPLVVGSPFMRFYAGAPLRTADGFNLGSLCLVDTKPREEFTDKQRHTLKEFAAVVMREMELARDNIHLTLRHRMQTSIEVFARNCLEMETNAADDDNGSENAHGLSDLYVSAAKAMREALQASGSVVFDLSHFEIIDSPINNGNGSVGPGGSKIFYPSPISAPDVTPYASFDDPTSIQTINSSGALAEESIHSQLVPAMAVLGADEDSSAPASREDPVPLSHHIRVAEFLRKHRLGHFYPVIPQIFRHLLPPNVSNLVLVPIFGLNKQPFALMCVYSALSRKGPALEDLQVSALQYIRSMGTIILSAVLKKDIMLADQAKSHFISNISHELRTPLHGILASAELLTDTKLNSTQGSYLETVEACGKSLLELVNHVLDFTKLSGGARVKGNAVHSLTPCDLVKLVQEVCESSWIGQMARRLESQQSAGIGSAYGSGTAGSSPTGAHDSENEEKAGGAQGAKGKKMKTGDVETIIDVSLRRSGWLVNCDAGGIRRVLMNLIGNSLKFTPTGFVHVSLREVQSTATHVVVELSVTDTGRGISKAFLEQQLFHPFTQENELGPGTGLGLSIVNSIVQSPSINGKIDVWSTVGQGTEMRITCEMAVAAPDDIEGAVYQPSLNLKQSKRVSFAGFEDTKGQTDLKQVLRNYFEGWWYFAACKEGPENAYSGDIVILNEDAGLLEDIRSKRRGRHLPPVILLTGSRGDTDVTEACEAYHAAGGIARMLFKPAGPAKLEALVDFCLQCLDRIDTGDPVEETQTAPSTPLPSPAPSPAVRLDMEGSDSYFALPSSEDREDQGVGTETANTPSNLAPALPTPWREVAAGEEDETPRTGSSRAPLSPLKSDAPHISPALIDLVNTGLVRRHSTEDHVVRHRTRDGPPSARRLVDGSSRAAQQGVEGIRVEDEAARRASAEALIASKRPQMKASPGSRPLMPPRSITFHAEPRLENHVTLSPSIWRDLNASDYFSMSQQGSGAEAEKKAGPGSTASAVPLEDPSPKQATIPLTPITPGALVPIEGSDGHVLRSAIGTVDGAISPAHVPGTRKLRVMGVDDNKINIKILAAFLGKLDVDFSSASNGAECVELFERTTPALDVIILDLTMPVLDGFQATLAIRQKEAERREKATKGSGASRRPSAPQPRVKILCLTGRSSAEDKRKAFACGADGFMTRPLSLKVLSSVLKLLTQPSQK
ncbi:hypothetical protein BCV69DRAFT_296699 [Microstroma glucosiphilum]|uniref:histidine kinase n=1 Tax=Pseudomicrostroma glucosiphilum TaxID=1684307 RepID=A0A316UC20_9BASI|nr:hypothetical protein BCV69DRAFT_296699 [Pseudomicrostroma glucosiphilum]PWN22719.1 hypothetical protein BCV69DRAFT_296699 [Pseudomicrostroma glucosiphilum]